MQPMAHAIYATRCSILTWCLSGLFCHIKPKFHYADFPVTSATSPRQTLNVSFSLNSITPTSPKLPGQESFGEVGVMEFGLKGTSRVCRGRHGEVGIVEFGLYLAQ